jgi:hypothetical protein
MLAMIALLESTRARSVQRKRCRKVAILEHHEQMRNHYERRRRPAIRSTRDSQCIVALPATDHHAARIRPRMRRLRYIGNQAPDNWSAAMAEHEAFIDALRARDGERLGRLMREHLANTWPRIESAVGSSTRGV